MSRRLSVGSSPGIKYCERELGDSCNVQKDASTRGQEVTRNMKPIETAIAVQYSVREESKVKMEVPRSNFECLNKAQVVATMADPTWRISRRSLFIGFWLAMVSMVIGAVVSVMMSEGLLKILGT